MATSISCLAQTAAANVSNLCPAPAIAPRRRHRTPCAWLPRPRCSTGRSTRRLATS